MTKTKATIDKKELALVKHLEGEGSKIPLVITSEEDAFKATDFILKVRKLFNDVEEKRTGYVAPFNEGIKKINDDFKQLTVPLAEMESAHKAALEKYALSRSLEDKKKLDVLREETGDTTLTIPVGLKNIPGVTGEIRFKKSFDIIITDASLVPERFKVTTVDTKALEAAIKEAEGDVKIPGVEVRESFKSAIYAK